MLKILRCTHTRASLCDDCRTTNTAEQLRDADDWMLRHLMERGKQELVKEG